MADDRYQIEESRSEAGRQILSMTDSVGFGAFAAGWIHDIPTGSWRYLLSTPMLKSEGPLWVYKRLNIVFKHIPLPEGISPLDIFVIDPELEFSLFGAGVWIEETPARLQGLLDPSISGIVLMINVDVKIDGFAVTDGFASFYRRISPASRKKKTSPVRKFDHKVKMLEAA